MECLENLQDVHIDAELDQCVGEVFFTHSKNIIYRCLCCSEIYPRVKDFVKHLMAANIIDVEPTEEILTNSQSNDFDNAIADLEHILKEEIKAEEVFQQIEHEAITAKPSTNIANVNYDEEYYIEEHEQEPQYYHEDNETTNADIILETDEDLYILDQQEIADSPTNSISDMDESKFDGVEVLEWQDSAEEYALIDDDVDSDEPANLDILHTSDNQLDDKVTENSADDNFEIKCDNETLQVALQKLKDLRKKSRPKKKKTNATDQTDSVDGKTNKPELTVQCPDCDFVTATVHRLKQHTIRMHRPPEKVYKCPICGLRSNNKYNLKCHIRRHTEVKKFCCSFCAALFHTATELKRHERCHTGERPYVCNKCGKQFASSGQLHMHQKRELKEKPYVCEICDKSFTAKDTLKVHLSVHDNVRNFACEFCEARFARRKTYMEHRKLHLNKREHACPYCDKAFNQKPGLSLHLKSKHGHKPIRKPACAKVEE